MLQRVEGGQEGDGGIRHVLGRARGAVVAAAGALRGRVGEGWVKDGAVMCVCVCMCVSILSCVCPYRFASIYQPSSSFIVHNCPSLSPTYLRGIYIYIWIYIYTQTQTHSNTQSYAYPASHPISHLHSGRCRDRLLLSALLAMSHPSAGASASCFLRSKGRASQGRDHHAGREGRGSRESNGPH